MISICTPCLLRNSAVFSMIAWTFIVWGCTQHTRQRSQVSAARRWLDRQQARGGVALISSVCRYHSQPQFHTTLYFTLLFCSLQQIFSNLWFLGLGFQRSHSCKWTNRRTKWARRSLRNICARKRKSEREIKTHRRIASTVTFSLTFTQPMKSQRHPASRTI